MRFEPFFWIGVLILMNSIAGSAGLKCYECTVFEGMPEDTDENCPGPSYLIDVDNKVRMTQTTPTATHVLSFPLSSFTMAAHKYCVVGNGTYLGAKFLALGFALSNNSNLAGTCDEENVTGIPITACYCQTDKCNSASAISCSYILMIVATATCLAKVLV